MTVPHNLTPQDYGEFQKLTITRNIVDRAQIFRVSRDAAELQYGIHLDCEGGVCFPHFLPALNGNDTKHPVSYSVRQDKPKFDAAGKPERKYVATKGRQHPYVAPVDPCLYEDPNVPIIIVEAQKSALAILRWCEDHKRRLIPVGIAGCYGWRGQTGIAPNAEGEREPVKGLLPGLAALCQGRRVYILLDQNAATNPQVQHGRAWLAETLLTDKVTTDVRLLTLPVAITAPFWNGPDDFLAAAGDEAFAELFESAERVEAVSKVAAPHLLQDMPEAVLDGYLGDLTQNLMGRYARGYAWASIVTVASAMVPRKRESQHFNLYTANVGPVGSGKTSAERAAQQLLGISAPVLLASKIGSGEGLVDRCADAEGSPRLYYPEELSHLFVKMAIENSSFGQLLTGAFNNDHVELVLAKRKRVTMHASLSILGGLVDQKFDDYFGSASTLGLYDRFLFGTCADGYMMDYLPFEQALHPEAKPIDIDPEVWEAKQAWTKEDPAIPPRVGEIAIRVAGICAAFDDRPVLKAADLGHAHALAVQQTRVRAVYKPNAGENAGGRVAEKILNYLDQFNGYVGKRDMARALTLTRYDPRVAEGVYARLVANGEVIEKKNGKKVLIRRPRPDEYQ